MATSGDSMALVPNNQANPTFAQTGTVDWTSVSEMTFSASVAVLGRLSNAGLEPLTVAIAQAMSTNIPIGVHGENRLRDVMSSLKSFSSFGDVVFFGIGVRHVLRTLVQTSQGASSVALVAALTEGHSTIICALRDDKLTKSPADITPSYAQWEKYAETCAGLFSTSIFGHKVAQITRLCGLTKNAEVRSKTNAASAEDMAKAICAIGNVQRGQCDSIEFVGGPSCCWMSVFREFFLGLHVEVYLLDGTIIFASGNKAAGDRPQVKFRVGITDTSHALVATGRTIFLTSEEFVSHWHKTVDPSLSSLTGRLHRDTMIRDSFTNTAEILTPAGWAALHFAALFASAAKFYCQTRLVSRYPTPAAFIQKAIHSIPELLPIKELLFSSAALMEVAALDTTERQYQAAARKIQSISKVTTIDTCEAIIMLASVLAETILDDDLNITTVGMRYFYEKVAKRTYLEPSNVTSESCKEDHATHSRFEELGIAHVKQNVQAEASVTGEHNISQTLRRLFLIDNLEHNDPKLYDMFLLLSILYSGFPVSLPRDRSISDDNYISAISSGGIYFYIDILRSLESEYHDASSIHIGRGCIQSSSRVYPSVKDSRRGAVWEDSFLTNDVPSEMLESRPGEIKVDGVVDEHVNLSFTYRLRSPGHTYDIGPSRFLRCMGWNYHYRSDSEVRIRKSWPSEIVNPRQWAINQDADLLASLAGVELTDNYLPLRCLLMCEKAPKRAIIDGPEDLRMFLTTLAWGMGRAEWDERPEEDERAKEDEWTEWIKRAEEVIFRRVESFEAALRERCRQYQVFY